MSSPTHVHFPQLVISSGGKRRDDALHVRIATASRSREISLVNDYDGVFKESVES